MTKAQLNKLFQFWNEESKRDFESAKAIIKEAKRYGGGLFFLHLSIEKKLKALYCRKFERHAPMTHNLLTLTENCQINLPKKLLKELATINEFNMSTRYPDEKQKIMKRFNQKFANQYLKLGEEILDWLETN